MVGGRVVEARPEERARIREGVALVTFPARGVVHLAGPDGIAFLQGLVSNDVAKLEDGSGCRAAILTPVGRVFALLDAFRAAGEALYLLLQDGRGSAVVEFLERYRFNERVEIAELSRDLSWLSLQGPLAPDAAAAAIDAGSDLRDHRLQVLTFGGHTLRVLRIDEAGVPGLHFLVRQEGREALEAALLGAARKRGGGAVGVDAWHVCRVEAGTPWMGAELDERILPMEANLAPILDLAKGCYIGQEVVSRGIVQGRSNWGLWGLRLPPESGIGPGDDLKVGDRPRPAVRVRSVARSPAARELLALAYVHREAARPGPLEVMTGRGAVRLTIEELPFRLDASPSPDPSPVASPASAQGRREPASAGSDLESL